MRPLFEIKLYNRRVTAEEILGDMKRIAGEGEGRPMTFGRYAEQGRFSTHTIAHRFGSWNAALKAAGLPTNIDRNVPDADLFENLAEVWRTLGRQPGGRDLVKRGGVSRFAASAYTLRFGGWNKALLAFAAFLQDGERVAGKARAKDCATPARRKRIRQKSAPRQINWRLRATVLIRDNCLCRMCGASPAKDPTVTLHVDHIVPWSKGGPTILGNLQTLCAACNIGKGDAWFGKRAAPTAPKGSASRCL